MLGFLSKILRGQSHPLNKIYISQVNLRHNYQYLASLKPGIKVAPVLKSNAYGHGIGLVGQILEEEDVPFFCVDSLLEAYQLRRAGVKSEILIMGFIDPRSLMNRKTDFQFAIYDLDLAKVINKYQKGAKIHIFVDTGMNREGVKLKDLDQFIKKLKELKDLQVVGLMSHLAHADHPRNFQTQKQYQNFKKALEIVKNNQIKLDWYHLGGSVFINYVTKETCNLVRSGIELYGIDRSGRNKQLRPVLSMYTKIVQIKEISLSDEVGYEGDFKASKKMVIGILPIGYNDGVDRALSGKGSVLVKDVTCQILGLISMNMTTVDLTAVKDPQVGDEVVIFSDKKESTNSIEKSAQLANLTPYVLLVHLINTTRREIIQ
jgi:alanine racemase